jgi:hypothetical protein
MHSLRTNFSRVPSLFDVDCGNLIWNSMWYYLYHSRDLTMADCSSIPAFRNTPFRCSYCNSVDILDPVQLTELVLTSLHIDPLDTCVYCRSVPARYGTVPYGRTGTVRRMYRYCTVPYRTVRYRTCVNCQRINKYRDVLYLIRVLNIPEHITEIHH